MRVARSYSWAGRIPVGEVRNQFAVNTDWMQLFAEFMCIKLDSKIWDGISLDTLLSMIIKKYITQPGLYLGNTKICGRFVKGKWKLLGNPSIQAARI